MSTLAHVGADYAHYTKRAAPQDPLDRRRRPQVLPSREARRAGAGSGRRFGTGGAGRRDARGLDGDRGFVIVHRCGADFHFLLTAVGAANEAGRRLGIVMARWPVSRPSTRPIRRVRRVPSDLLRLGDGIVAHESAASSRFLASPRGEAIWLVGAPTCSPGPSDPLRKARREYRKLNGLNPPFLYAG